MTSPIINAAPMNLPQGTQDLSAQPLTPIAEAIPTHLPKTYIFAKKGPKTPMLVTGDSRINTYGADTFDLRQKWANHATVLSNVVNAAGNQQMIQRLLPADIGPQSNITFWLDVLETALPVWKRNTDGSYMLDTAGDKIQETVGTSPAVPVTTPGFKVKWVTTTSALPADDENFGQYPIAAGDQTDVGLGTQSQRYPIIQFKASDLGEDGNNRGMRLWAPTLTSNQTPLNKTVMDGIGAYPFFVQMISRTNPTVTPRVFETILGDQNVQVTWKPNAINPTTDQTMNITDVLLDSYRNLKNVTFPITYGLFSDMFVYQDHVETLLQQFYDAEFTYQTTTGGNSDVGTDFFGEPDEQWLFNLISGVNSSGVPYSTYQFATGSNAVTLNQFQNVYAGGGSDGTMDLTSFDTLVSEAMLDYADENSDMQNLAINVESIMYDSGYGLQAKYSLLNFIAVRKDTFVVLGTHTAGQPPLDNAAEESTAIALRARAEFFPESDYFGTPVMRALIMGRSGQMLNSQYTGFLPLTLEVANKAATYMGAGDGKWKTGKNFAGAPGSIVTTMTNVNITYTPGTVRNRNWAAGLNWVQAYDRRQNFIPAFKTVYNDDTSVLNSFLTAMAICELNKVCDRAWRQFSGVDNLTPAQLIERVNKFVIANTQGRFDGRFIIRPRTELTSQDANRGYSWTTTVDIYAPNMVTVMTTIIRAFRIADFNSQSA